MIKNFKCNLHNAALMQPVLSVNLYGYEYLLWVE